MAARDVVWGIVVLSGAQENVGDLMQMAKSISFGVGFDFFAYDFAS